MQSDIIFRDLVTEKDRENVRDIVTSTGFFHDHEIHVAVELVDITLEHGNEDGYNFVFAEYEGKTIGYCCYGLIACTKSSYDIYWIAVHNDQRGKGIGKIILQKTEEEIKKLGGSGVYLETSSKELYKPTRQFYLNTGYIAEAIIKDFYDTDDDKFIFSKKI